MEYRIRLAGDSALLIEFEQDIKQETNQKIKAMLQLLKEQPIEGVHDIIPAFASLLINYDPHILSYKSLVSQLTTLLQQDIRTAQKEQRIIEIPVCYGGEYGPDIQFVAQNAGLSEAEVIARHTSRDYLIYMLGFLPGFPYLGGLDETIHTPRLENPRLTIAAGSVGIGGSQTGIYPLASPGGWRLIGRTPLKTYDPQKQQPFIFGAGDYIRFKAVDESDYHSIHQAVLAGSYEIAVLTGEEVRNGD
ncbi:5-oxoprolinase subunit PxpB [Streptococcus devriesei]|uniref:5-oxoprolinase subunit PxpB n=1 Tax=Streptococcus devriesei TaxID=231233 RepID=UPI000403BDEA|nr:5-oxoprolinase subunit PxpB [Streptococcus devriesei]